MKWISKGGKKGEKYFQSFSKKRNKIFRFSLGKKNWRVCVCRQQEEDARFLHSDDSSVYANLISHHAAHLYPSLQLSPLEMILKDIKFQFPAHHFRFLFAEVMIEMKKVKLVEEMTSTLR